MLFCFDIGGTAIKYGVAALANDQIRFVHQNQIPTQAKERGGKGIFDVVCSLICELQQNYSPKGIAISTAGMVDPQRGIIRYANENIPFYTGLNWKLRIANEFGLSCSVENDVNAAILGEYAYGAGRGSHSMLGITVGTGIGGAIILQGEIYHGFSGSAGEIGYTLVNGKNLENQASTTALVSRVQTKRNSLEFLDGREIFKCAIAGDAVCREEIERMCDSLAQAIVNAVCLFNPEKVVLGGGVMEQKDYLQPIIDTAIEKYLHQEIRKNTSIVFATLGNQAGLFGAYYHFWKESQSNY